MTVYELMHIFHPYENSVLIEPINLGLYTSYNSIQEAIQFYKKVPGFCNCQNAFSIRHREVTGAIKHNTIFEVIIYFHTENYESEYHIELGIFGNENDAHAALETYCRENCALNGYDEIVIEKIVNRCILDEREWIEGFIVY